MPIFEYECLECRQQFERLVRSTDAQVVCPSCGRDNLQRLVSLYGFSSEATSAANLSAAHKRAAQKRQEKLRSDHTEHHDHFGDSSK